MIAGNDVGFCYQLQIGHLILEVKYERRIMAIHSNSLTVKFEDFLKFSIHRSGSKITCGWL